MTRWRKPKPKEPDQWGMRQPLFTFGNPAARARVGDPQSSVLAALEVERKGIAQTQRERLLRCIILHQNRLRTAFELARLLGMRRDQPGRRLKEIEECGLIERGQLRRCDVTGRQCLTWKLSGYASEMLAQGYRAEQLIAGEEK